jgi:hypothetical protein
MSRYENGAADWCTDDEPVGSRHIRLMASFAHPNGRYGLADADPSGLGCGLLRDNSCHRGGAAIVA